MRHLSLVLKINLIAILVLQFGDLGAQDPTAAPATQAAGTPPQSPPSDHANVHEASPQSLVESATAAADAAAKHAESAAAAATAAAATADSKSAAAAADAAAKEADAADVQVAYTAYAIKQAKLANDGSADAVTAANTKAVAAAKAAHKSSAAARFAAAIAKGKDNYTCTFYWNDCDWQYWVIGGGEESALSSQDSQTNPFVSLFVRAPTDNRNGSVWLLARFLGAANANNTNNVVAATQSASGSSSTSGLPQVGTAVDYTIGLQHDLFQPTEDFPEKGGFTIGGIVGFGATTPLSAQHATTAYVVPAYGTNECDELLARFPSSAHAGLPAQPSTPYITTTTTPSGGSATTTTSGPFCIINPVPITTTTTANGSTSTVAASGTAQTDIAFAPEDRNSFLLKYLVGARLIDRRPIKGNTSCTLDTPCTRTVVDLTVGQDEAITGGTLRHFVAKAEADFPIPKATSISFFGSAALRFSRNQNQSPLILQPATIVSTSATPPATISLPSTSTWILPLTQPNRDFYRIGIGIDLTDLLAKAFTPKS